MSDADAIAELRERVERLEKYLGARSLSEIQADDAVATMRAMALAYAIPCIGEDDLVSEHHAALLLGSDPERLRAARRAGTGPEWTKHRGRYFYPLIALALWGLRNPAKGRLTSGGG